MSYVRSDQTIPKCIEPRKPIVPISWSVAYEIPVALLMIKYMDMFAIRRPTGSVG
jgi:hypothetical protein